ncbi:unnamed protein product, partial [Oppiella nova]
MSWPYYGNEKVPKNQYTKLETVRYPKPGRPNPTIKLYYINLSQLQSYNESRVQELTVHLKPPKDILDLGDHYMTTCKWIDDDVLTINWMTRAQNFSVMTSYNTQTFEPISNFKLQTSNGWIDLFTEPVVTLDKSSYIVRVPKMSDNKKDVFEHIAEVSIMSAESTYLTSATFPDSPGSKHLMSVSLNQSAVTATPTCHTCLMNTYSTDKTQICLTSNTIFSENAGYYILNCLGPNIPRSEIRRTSDDSLIHTLEDNKHLDFKLKDLSLPKKISMKVPVGGYEIDVMLIVPQDFDEKSPKKYPLIFNVYGGPGSDSVSVHQNYFYHQFGAYLVSNKSVIYATLDTRGSPNHGCKFILSTCMRLSGSSLPSSRTEFTKLSTTITSYLLSKNSSTQ